MRYCDKCRRWFDSAKDSSVCPHPRVWTAPTLAAENLLVSNDVRDRTGQR